MTRSRQPPIEDRAGFLLPEAAFYRLRDLHEQITLLATLALPRSNSDASEPHLPCGAWASSLQQLGRQLKHSIDRAQWHPSATGRAAQSKEPDA